MAAGVRTEPYSRDILRLASTLPDAPPLDAPDASIELRSPTCGSVISLSLATRDELVDMVRADVSACAYGQAATALMLEHAPGRSGADIERALMSIEDWLKGSDALAPDWPGIEVLAPARERSGRHGAVLLPFRALARAMQETK